MADANPMISAARGLNLDDDFRWGFNIGTAVCAGSSIGGPGQTAARNQLAMKNSGPMVGSAGGALGMQGFDVAQALQHGIAKANVGAVVPAQSTSPTANAGQTITNGLAGANSTADHKAATMAVVASNPTARVGAQTAITQIAAQPQGLWARFLAFFGF
jgi:hypothetical protein